MSPEQVLAQYVAQAYRTLNPVVPSHGVFGSESPDIELPRLAKAYNRENGSYLFQNSMSVILSLSASPEPQSWPSTSLRSVSFANEQVFEILVGRKSSQLSICQRN